MAKSSKQQLEELVNSICQRDKSLIRPVIREAIEAYANERVDEAEYNTAMYLVGKDDEQISEYIRGLTASHHQKEQGNE